MKKRGTVFISLTNIRRVFRLSPRSVRKLVFGNVLSSIRYFLSTYVLARIFAEAVDPSRSADSGFSALAGPALIVFVLLLVLSAGSTFFNRNAVVELDIALKKYLLDKTVRGGPRESGKDDGRVSALVNDIPLITESLETILGIFVEVLVLGVGGLLLVAAVSPLVGAAVLALECVNILYSLFFARKLYRATQAIQEKAARLLKTVKAMLEGTVLFRFFFPREKAFAAYDAAARERAKAGTHRAVVSGLLGGINNAVLKLTALALYLVSAVFLFSGQLAQALFLQIVQWGELAVGSFMFSRELVEIQKSAVGANRVWEMLDEIRPETTGTEIAGSFPGPVIEFQDVSFRYGDRAVLENVSFSINQGEFIAVTGRSGGGKTTALRLILGLCFPTAGRVLVRGLDTGCWDLAALRNLISVVPQENNLFSGTVRENIAIDRPVSDAEVKRAAEMAGASGFIEALPNGYDTCVSEKGDTLSGGQKQRIAIARAIVRNTPVILLDEASSAIDEAMERELIATLKQIARGRTVIFVSHRQQAVEAGDRQILLG